MRVRVVRIQLDREAQLPLRGEHTADPRREIAPGGVRLRERRVERERAVGGVERSLHASTSVRGAQDVSQRQAAVRSRVHRIRLDGRLEVADCLGDVLAPLAQLIATP